MNTHEEITGLKMKTYLKPRSWVFLIGHTLSASVGMLLVYRRSLNLLAQDTDTAVKTPYQWLPGILCGEGLEASRWKRTRVVARGPEPYQLLQRPYLLNENLLRVPVILKCPEHFRLFVDLYTHCSLGLECSLCVFFLNDCMSSKSQEAFFDLSKNSWLYFSVIF